MSTAGTDNELQLILIKPDDLDAAESAAWDAALKEYDVKEVEPPESGPFQPEIAPILALVLIGGGVFIAQFISDQIEIIRGGTEIDLRGEQPKYRRIRELDRGILVLIAKDGTVTIDAKDIPKNATERILSILFEQVGKGVEITTDVIKKITDAVVKGIKDDDNEEEDSGE